MLLDTHPSEDYSISYFKRPSELKNSCKNSYWAIYFITQVRYGVPPRSGMVYHPGQVWCTLYVFKAHSGTHTHVHAHTHKQASLCEKTLPSILPLFEQIAKTILKY